MVSISKYQNIRCYVEKQICPFLAICRNILQNIQVVTDRTTLTPTGFPIALLKGFQGTCQKCRYFFFELSHCPLTLVICATQKTCFGSSFFLQKILLLTNFDQGKAPWTYIFGKQWISGFSWCFWKQFFLSCWSSEFWEHSVVFGDF